MQRELVDWKQAEDRAPSTASCRAVPAASTTTGGSCPAIASSSSPLVGARLPITAVTNIPASFSRPRRG